MATTRRRFTAQFKAKVAMEALRGDRTIQAIAAKHEVHPNQVSGWKRQAQAGLQELFAGASNRRQKDHDVWDPGLTPLRQSSMVTPLGGRGNRHS